MMPQRAKANLQKQRYCATNKKVLDVNQEKTVAEDQVPISMVQELCFTV